MFAITVSGDLDETIQYLEAVRYRLTDLIGLANEIGQILHADNFQARSQGLDKDGVPFAPLSPWTMEWGMRAGGHSGGNAPPTAPRAPVPVGPRPPQRQSGTSGLNFRPSYHAERHTVVVADVRRLEAEFALDPESHVGPGGVGRSAKPGAYAGADVFMERARSSGQGVDMPRLALDQHGRAFIIDGRHRFAVLRDQGVTEIPVTVHPGDAAAFRAKYGVRHQER
jgi:hypothetical protein